MSCSTSPLFLLSSAIRREGRFSLLWNLPKPIEDLIDQKVPHIRVEKNLVDVLAEGGVDPAALEAAIISYHHYDHTGDPSTFSKSMDLIAGPGFTKEFLPGYPTVQASPLFEDSFEGRNVRELDFDGCSEVAGFSADDYFEDGSLYILNSPGHAIGHISAQCGQARAYSFFLAEIFVMLMDLSSRLSYIPMPLILSSYKLGRGPDLLATLCCPDLTSCHPTQQCARTLLYYDVYTSCDSWL
jgi:hypothetical protein